MPIRRRRVVTLLAGISLSALPVSVTAQVSAPAAANPAGDADICTQLGLSPESEAVAPPQAVTESVAKTASSAKEAGVTISGPATPSPTPSPTGSPSATPSPRPTASPTPVTPPLSSSAQCKRGINQAQTDQASLNRAKAAKNTLVAAANRYGIDWRILAAIGVRETNFQNKSSFDGGEGIFQLTNQPGVSKAQAWDINFASQYAAKMISTEMRYVRNKCPNFNSTQVLQAAAAIYNFGRKARNGSDNITCNPATIDQGTTGNNYGSNILNLIQCY